MLDSGDDSAAATTRSHPSTTKTPARPVTETPRSKSLATLYTARVLHSTSQHSPQLMCWGRRLKKKVTCILSVNGGWSAWSLWSPCSSECNSGVQIRERFCSSPSPQHGGNSCPGPHIQTRDCNSHPCSGGASCLAKAS